ncbi:aldehyde dehydrogenase family protein [Pseudofrankia inefficax]|uniref:Aldehyde Dehydrogenase n=1 Tax=Pseudofrankia inefficax (strain DSM 45817 / CECT 9037 / DDB 130130 / EuI1c) TaxID=298654 RepID=E3J7V3_PSEI1|nr:aldehyde dehydrogenase family protein [Pseudofrankia inefficax]ADP80857.1 Aldehyde Dehydrogenase [Pseudofrankia inefficax]
MLTRDKLFIDGRWVAPATTETLNVINPATEEVFGSIPAAGAADVDRAVAAARQAFEGPWRRLDPTERGAMLLRFLDELRKRWDDLAPIYTGEAGFTITTSHKIEGIVSQLVNFYVDQAAVYPWMERRPCHDVEQGHLDVIVQQYPVGVVGAIVPWNGPQLITMMKLAPALLAGCTAVLKTAPEASLNMAYYGDAWEAAGLPAGVLNILTGGAATGALLAEHPGVDRVSFTGSPSNGRSVALASARQLKGVTLELGGKSPAILLDDADIEAAALNCAYTFLPGAGQQCIANARVLAPRARYDEVVDAFAAVYDKFPIGDPMDPNTRVGPVISAHSRDRVLGMIEAAKAEGAKVVKGGGRPAGLDRGFYVDKTLFRDVDNSMSIAQNEVFGPVCVIIPHDGDEDALRLANDSMYGLGGSVWSADQQRAFDVAKEVRSGALGINGFTLDPAGPLGGFRDSGIGCERGVEAFRDFLQPKGILVPRDGSIVI